MLRRDARDEKIEQIEAIIVELAAEAARGHFGATLQSFILYQYYHAQVTEPLILEELREWGVQMSSGQLHRLITEGQEQFHKEKDEILEVGLRVSSHIHVDDTGARHQGKNGYCTHIGNEWFAWFASTGSKSRINFLTLLRAGRTDYVLNDAALEYMAGQKLPQALLGLLKTEAKDDLVFADEASWKAALTRWDITEKRHVRIATEGALLSTVLAHGVKPELAIVSDDAGQFNVLCHALCWIHAERVLAKLVGFNEDQRAALEQVRTTVWERTATSKCTRRRRGRRFAPRSRSASTNSARPRPAFRPSITHWCEWAATSVSCCGSSSAPTCRCTTT